MTTWSPEQERALSAVAKWLKDGGPQVFRLFGYAGTGKTTLAKHLANDVKCVQFASFTGKAAHVMRSKGCRGARTIHSLIYRMEVLGANSFTWVINEESDLHHCDLVIVDECSMVNADIGHDLLIFGKKILVLGDPMQLPPVEGAGFFTHNSRGEALTPDFMLTEIHRQAADNPIIHLATNVRTGQGLKTGSYGESVVCHKSSIHAADRNASDADQVICGRNITRHHYNSMLRTRHNEQVDWYPEIGEKLICLANERKKGLLNGQFWQVHEVHEVEQDFVRMDLTSLDEEDTQLTKLRCHSHIFRGETKKMTLREKSQYSQFDYGYALTCHKAQGSQWDNVFLRNEAYCFREHSLNWLYTAITRAAERIIIIK